MSDYSGIDCVREAAEMVLEGCKRKFDFSFAGSPFKFLRTCDVGALQSQVLLKVAITHDSSNPCHFKDILDRLPLSGRNYISAALPSKAASKIEKAQAHQHIQTWIVANRAWLFPADATCYCYVHMRHCSIWGKMDEDDNETEADNIADDRGPQALRIASAGNCCQAWSKAGIGHPQSHPSEVTHDVWLEERSVRFEQAREDLLFNECTPRYPAEQRFKDKFGDDSVHVVSITTGPELFGWPTKRLRKLSAVVNKRTWCWLGPETHDGIQADFAGRFYKGAQCDGSALLNAPRSHQMQECAELAQERRFSVTAEGCGLVTKTSLLGMLLPPGGIDRLFEWDVKRKSQLGDSAGVFMCDAEQTSAGSTGGLDWPVQLTHGMIFMLMPGGDPEASTWGPLNWRLATGLEHLGAMGFRVFDDELGPCRLSKLMDPLKMAAPRHLKMLCGNGMHLTTQGAFMLYVLSHIAPVDNKMAKAMPDKGSSSITKRNSWLVDDDADDNE